MAKLTLDQKIEKVNAQIKKEEEEPSSQQRSHSSSMHHHAANRVIALISKDRMVFNATIL